MVIIELKKKKTGITVDLHKIELVNFSTAFFDKVLVVGTDRK